MTDVRTSSGRVGIGSDDVFDKFGSTAAVFDRGQSRQLRNDEPAIAEPTLSTGQRTAQNRQN